MTVPRRIGLPEGEKSVRLKYHSGVSTRTSRRRARPAGHRTGRPQKLGNPLRLRFPGSQIARWAGRFSDPDADDAVSAIGSRAKSRGYLTRDEFLRLCRWKSPRSRPRVESNAPEFVRAVTATALATVDERLRIEVLTLLEGVHWPTASVILHFCHRDPYPILDVRSLWSLGVERPVYDFAFWRAFTTTCRSLAERHSCSLRTLDRALWQYSKERQGKSPAAPPRERRLGGVR
jgi:hypothetical protein